MSKLEWRRLWWEKADQRWQKAIRGRAAISSPAVRAEDRHSRKVGMSTADVELHKALCNAVWQAAGNGRTDALQKLYDRLNQNEKDALRMWLSVSADTFGIGKDAKPWIMLKEGKLKIIKGTVANRPHREAITAVADDVGRYFLNR